MKPELIEQLTQCTINAAISAFPLFGKNQKEEADALAVNALRNSLNNINARARIIIGEGEKDSAPMLYSGEILGKGIEEIDLAVDPLECTTNFSMGLPNSMSVLGFTEKEKLHPVPGTYMEQWIAAPGHSKKVFDLTKSIRVNLESLSRVREKPIQELTIVVQDRPRHSHIIQELRSLGCGISLIDSGSLNATLEICLGLGQADALLGTYGAPEGLMSAIIAKITNADMKAVMRPHSPKHQKDWETFGYPENKILDCNELITGKDIGFIGTCISGNQVLKGLRKNSSGKINGSSIILTPNSFASGQYIHEFSISI